MVGKRGGGRSFVSLTVSISVTMVDIGRCNSTVSPPFMKGESISDSSMSSISVSSGLVAKITKNSLIYASIVLVRSASIQD